MAKSDGTKVGENVTYSLEGDTLTITIDVSHRHDMGTDPKTGQPRKTIRVASTLGNTELADTEGVYLGINAYVYRVPK